MYGEQLQHFRAILETRKQMLETRQRKAPKVRITPTSNAFDELPGRRMDKLARLLFVEKLSRDTHLELAQVTAALRRMDEGSYGKCCACEESIASARLQLLPHTPLCHACAELAHPTLAVEA